MKKIFKVLFKIIIISIISALLIDGYVYLNGRRHMESVNEAEAHFGDAPADCAIVLGAALNYDGTPSKVLRKRLDRGVELYHKGLVRKLLLSGDNGTIEYNEVESMKKYALSQGVRQEDLFLDHAGFSTYESMYRAGAVFGVRRAIVVTQPFHEYRAIYAGRRLGIDAVGVPCTDDYFTGKDQVILREHPARIKDFVQSIYKAKPKYLGDKIDISGDGRQSW